MSVSHTLEIFSPEEIITWQGSKVREEEQRQKSSTNLLQMENDNEDGDGKRIEVATRTMLVVPGAPLPTPKQIKIRQARDNKGIQVMVYGWVHRCPSKGDNLTSAILRDGTGFLQCVMGNNQCQNGDDVTLVTESTIVVYGVIREVPHKSQVSGGLGDESRLLAGPGIFITGRDRPPPKRGHIYEVEPSDAHFDQRHLMLRGENTSKVLKIRSVIIRCLRDHYYDRGYFEVSPPTLVPIQVEGTCTPLKTDYYGKEVQLTLTSQMYLETALSSLGDVFSIAPSYRVEQQATRRHLTEYTHCEAECPFITFDGLLERLEDVICDVVDRVLCSPFAHLLYDLHPDFKAPKRPFRRMNYSDAILWLRTHEITKEDGSYYQFGDDIPEAPERKMVDILNEPIFLCRFPTILKPFYMQRCLEDNHLTQSVDLLMPNVGEVVGASMRMWQLDELLEGFKEDGLDPTPYFWYTDQLKYGSCPHGGYGLGIERFLCWFLNRFHIREVCLYPRNMERCVP